MSVTNVTSDLSAFSRVENTTQLEVPPRRLEIVIEDSDWDDAQVLD